MATTPKKLPNGRWRVQVYLGRHPETHKVQFKSITKDTLKDAEKAARKWETKKDNNEEITTDKRTLAQYLTAWLALKERGSVMDRNGMTKRIGPRTMDDYRRLLTEWILAPKHKDLPWTGRARLDKVTYHTLNTLYRAMERLTTFGTIKKLNSLLGQVFYEVEQKGILSKNPAEWTNVPQPEETADDGEDASSHSMDEEQAARFLSGARALADAEGDKLDPMPERCWSALWHVLLGGGLRPGEAFALRWDDVHEISHEVQVRQNLVRVRGVKGYELRKPKTKKGRREVPLPDSVWRELMAWKKAQRWNQQRVAGDEWQDLGFVFTTGKGTPLHGARDAWQRVCAKVGLGELGRAHVRIECWCKEKHGASGPLPARDFAPEFRIYDLRHTNATLMLLNGTPPNVVADRLGHENPGFTIKQYGHSLPKQAREATQKLEGLLFKTG